MEIKVKGLEKVRENLAKAARRAQELKRSLNGRSVTVGIPACAKYPDGTPVARVAAMVEYGTAKMEPRPFMRTARAENSAKWRAMLKTAARNAALGKTTIDKALMRVGETMKRDIQDAVMAQGAVRTGRLRDSFTVTVGAMAARTPATSPIVNATG